MSETRLGALGLDQYATYFKGSGTPQPGNIRLDVKYYTDRDSDIYKQAAALDYNERLPDSTLEFAIMSYYTATVNIRPVEAAKLLPANSQESEVKLAAATYAELQEIRFLDPQNSGRIGRYEGMLKFITDKQKITQAEITASLRASIHAVVDAEFNRVDFSLRNTSSSHNGVLTRNPQNGHYTLNYGGTYTNNQTKELTAPMLEALSLEMRDGKNKADFTQLSID